MQKENKNSSSLETATGDEYQLHNIKPIHKPGDIGQRLTQTPTTI
jgi:hypothetical protein